MKKKAKNTGPNTLPPITALRVVRKKKHMTNGAPGSAANHGSGQ